MNIHIREIDLLNNDDVYNFAKLHEQVPIEWDKSYKCVKEAIIRRQKIVLNTKNQCILFAEDKKKIIGIYWALIEEKSSEKASLIGSLWVEENYRKKGIATLLMNKGEEWALKKGAKFQFLSVHFNNVNAIEYYKNLGFSPRYLDMFKECSTSAEDALADFIISEAKRNKGGICETVLRSLPQWFSIESAIKQYIVEVEKMPMLTIGSGNKTVGFLSYRKHFENSCEIYVMGIMPDHHRKGLGTALIYRLQKIIKEEGGNFLQVKTLSPTRESEEYRQTRKFYLSLGFTPLEEFKQLWGEDNPCLLLVKKI